jgi:ribose/xylose/arabinose/galactoside ABC-type transport system permease subunit
MDSSNNNHKNSNNRRLKLSADALQNITIFGLLVVLVIIASIIEPAFLGVQNLSNVLMQISSVVMVSSVVTLVLNTGNLDLSVGGVGAMAGVLYAVFARAGLPIAQSAILAILCGGIVGLINGSLISTLRLPSFIITVATMYIARGIAFIGAEGSVITSGLPGSFGNLGEVFLGTVPIPLVYAFIFFVVFLFIQNKTVLGKQAYAIGSNIKAAELSGISIRRVVTTIYTFVGLAAAFTGVVVSARFNQADCRILPGFEIDVVIASVLGGTDLGGGRGTVFGMLIGALILGILTNVLNMMGLILYYQYVIKGIVLVVAIVYNNYIRKTVKI